MVQLNRRIASAILGLTLFHLLLFSLLFAPVKPAFMKAFAHSGSALCLTDGFSTPLLEFLPHHSDLPPVFMILVAVAALVILLTNLFFSGGIITVIANREERFIAASGRHFFPFLLLGILVLVVVSLATALLTFLGLGLAHLFLPGGNGEWTFHIRWFLPAGLALCGLTFAKAWFDTARLLRVVRPYAGTLFHLTHGLAVALRKLPLLLLVLLAYALTGALIARLHSIPVLPLLLRWSLVFLYWGVFVRIAGERRSW